MWRDESKHVECDSIQQGGDITEPAHTSSVTEAGADASHADMHGHEEIKQEPADQDKDDEVAQSFYSECDVKEEVARELYPDHVIKEEMVIGPEVLLRTVPAQETSECATTIATQPSPLSQVRPQKRKHVAVAGADADYPAEKSRPPPAPPQWALDIENRRIREAELRRKLEERKLVLEERRLALEERRGERRLALDSLEERRGERRLALDSLEERRVEQDRTWRRELLSALQRFNVILQSFRDGSSSL